MAGATFVVRRRARAVCRVMDGGRGALERRYWRSGPESTHVR